MATDPKGKSLDALTQQLGVEDWLRLGHQGLAQPGKGLTKEQYKVTLPVQMIRKLGWEAKEKLKVWINQKKHIEMRKK